MSCLPRQLAVSVLLAITVGAHASPVTLETGEITSLRALIAKDPAAARTYAELKEAADAALADQPNPVARVISEGRLEKDPEKVRTTKSLEDMEKVEALAWTWAVTDDGRYATKAREFILAWAKVNQPDGNPINETKFEPMIEAYDLVRAGFPAADRARIDGWLGGKARALLANKRGERENWQSHRLKIVGLIGATIGDRELWKAADAGFRRHLSENFAPDGESLDFKRRDALHYHVYTVQPLLTLACVAQRSGDPLFTYSGDKGSSLEKAVDFVQPYAAGQKKHVEFARSEVKFDRTRAASGEKEYAAHNWNPKASARMFSEAGCLNPKYDELAASVAGRSEGRYVNWRSVLNAASARPTR